jgi:hypothetical protein
MASAATCPGGPSAVTAVGTPRWTTTNCGDPNVRARAGTTAIDTLTASVRQTISKLPDGRRRVRQRRSLLEHANRSSQSIFTQHQLDGDRPCGIGFDDRHAKACQERARNAELNGLPNGVSIGGRDGLEYR